mmetsp:Transcript_1862/g.4169  ORF Transcript_1862/g.4169 Transcript_1862/m.4169 type:complete len:286 (-) Transcript_1862:768-1625(-)
MIAEYSTRSPFWSATERLSVSAIENDSKPASGSLSFPPFARPPRSLSLDCSATARSLSGSSGSSSLESLRASSVSSGEGGACGRMNPFGVWSFCAFLERVLTPQGTGLSTRPSKRPSSISSNDTVPAASFTTRIAVSFPSWRLSTTLNSSSSPFTSPPSSSLPSSFFFPPPPRSFFSCVSFSSFSSSSFAPSLRSAPPSTSGVFSPSAFSPSASSNFFSSSLRCPGWNSLWKRNTGSSRSQHLMKAYGSPALHLVSTPCSRPSDVYLTTLTWTAFFFLVGLSRQI